MLITESFENLPRREKCPLNPGNYSNFLTCLLYTSDAADEERLV